MMAAGSLQIAAVLDGRYTFGNFVVGSGNRLAYAAAKSVAESPGENYSPLVVYAANGLGKTHLLAAIGRQLLLERPDLDVCYVSAATLGDTPLASSPAESTEDGRPVLHRADVLLIDDLHVSTAREGFQAELLQALEAVQRRKGQVVLASARALEELPGLDPAVLSALRGGLIVDIQNPDYETRAAILRFKVRQSGVDVAPEILEELARRQFESVRELEVALDRLLALRDQDPDALTQAGLHDLLRRQWPASSPAPASEFNDFFANVADTISSVLDETGVPVRRTVVAPQPLRRPLQQYTLGDWISGPANRMATECAWRVVAEPGTRFNPLFVHSATGMGKTHLLNAIGNAFLERDADSRVGYLSAEEFTEELITSIQEGSLPRARARYRTADLLLLDDVHSLAGKERTQEEFFHLFNELTARKRQIVLASDRPPRELSGVEERLISRFEGGLVVEIGPLDRPTAAASFLRFLQAEGFTLNEALASELARQLAPRNMREIQGQAKRAALRAESAGAKKDAAYLRRILLHQRRVPRETSSEKVDPFFTDRSKVFLHWELADRLVERMER